MEKISEEMKEKLEKLDACNEAIKWASTQPDYRAAWQNCERGDWMLWLAQVLNVDDRKLIFAKYLCSKQVQHLMEDQRSIDAMEASLRYANGEIGRDELNKYAEAAAYTADAAYAYDAADAAYAAAAAAYAYAAAAAAADDVAAKKESLKKSADICREILTEEVLIAYKKLKP